MNTKTQGAPNGAPCCFKKKLFFAAGLAGALCPWHRLHKLLAHHIGTLGLGLLPALGQILGCALGLFGAHLADFCLFLHILIHALGGGKLAHRADAIFHAALAVLHLLFGACA